MRKRFVFQLIFCSLFVSLPAAAAEQRISIDVPGGTLHGTLLTPDMFGKQPVALIIAGSGPTDRDGNSRLVPGRNDSLKLLAEALRDRGIASLRYDKRGIGESAPAGASEADLRFTLYVDDAEAWGRYLRKAPLAFGRLAVIGHSEGALLGLIAAQRLNADRVVSIAGAGRPAHKVIHEQLATRVSPEILKEADGILDQLVAGKIVEQAPSRELQGLFRPSVQPYMISWLKFDPAQEIAAAKMPVMIVQGTRDIQVGVTDAEALAKAQPRARLELIEGMNHVMKLVGEDKKEVNAGYTDPTRPIATKLVDAVSAFIIKD
ncbi:MAG: alpha/beta fold hydrolase [Betaproteobacteria bacterium]